MIYLLLHRNVTRNPYCIETRAFKLDDMPLDKVPTIVRQMAVLITEGKPESVIKDRYGLFDNQPPDKVDDIVKWLS